MSAFLAAQHGSGFAARSAVGSLSGVAAESAFCVAYAWTARRGWPPALAAATFAFAATGSVAEALPLTDRTAVVVALFGAAVASLAAALGLLPQAEGGVRPPAAPAARRDLPGRALVATALVVGLTELANVAGARLVGLIAVFPLYVSVLAVFGQRHGGRDAALSLLRGVLLGLTSFTGFFLVLALALGRIDTVAAYACATAAALAAQSVSLAAVRRV